MVQDFFSGPKFVYSIPFWVYRGPVSVEKTQCLCGTDTASVWDTHSVSVWDTHSPGGGGRAVGGHADILESLVPTRSTHTSLISLPRSCGWILAFGQDPLEARCRASNSCRLLKEIDLLLLHTVTYSSSF